MKGMHILASTLACLVRGFGSPLTDSRTEKMSLALALDKEDNLMAKHLKDEGWLLAPPED